MLNVWWSFIISCPQGMDVDEKYAKLQRKHEVLQDLLLQEVIDLDDEGFKMLLDEIGKDFAARSFLNKMRASFTAGGVSVCVLC